MPTWQKGENKLVADWGQGMREASHKHLSPVHEGRAAHGFTQSSGWLVLVGLPAPMQETPLA